MGKLYEGILTIKVKLTEEEGEEVAEKLNSPSDWEDWDVVNVVSLRQVS